MIYNATMSRPPHPAIIELRASQGAIPAIEQTLGCSLPQSQAMAYFDDGGTSWLCNVGPFAWLFMTAIEQERELEARLSAAVIDHHAACTVVTDAYAAFRVTGPDAREVLCQPLAIDLDAARFPIGSATRCGFGKSIAVVLHQDAMTYLLFVESPHEHYAGSLLAYAIGQPA